MASSQRDSAPEDWNLLIVVSRAHPARRDHLKHALQGVDWVEVIEDRRLEARRRSSDRAVRGAVRHYRVPERRLDDRRRWARVDDAFLLRGWTQVWYHRKRIAK